MQKCVKIVTIAVDQQSGQIKDNKMVSCLQWNDILTKKTNQFT